jgi:hypothetical protein
MGAIMRVQGPVPVVASHPIFTFEQEVGLSTLIARGELLEALALTQKDEPLGQCLALYD